MVVHLVLRVHPVRVVAQLYSPGLEWRGENVSAYRSRYGGYLEGALGDACDNGRIISFLENRRTYVKSVGLV